MSRRFQSSFTDCSRISNGKLYDTNKFYRGKAGFEGWYKESGHGYEFSPIFSKDYAYIQDELHQIVELTEGYGVTVKMIVEMVHLTDQQKLIAGKIAVDAGAGFIKTCAGFESRCATVHDIGLLVDNFGDKIKVKANGGIVSMDDAASFISMRVNRSAERRNIAKCHGIPAVV